MKNLINKFSNLSFVNKILLSLIIILVIALAATIYWPKGSESQYSAVYLTSGDLYFGKVSWFPRLTISNAYLLQRNQNDQQNPYSLSRFANAFWGPTDEMYLNRDTVLWIAPLRNDSQLVAYINKAQQEATQTNNYAPTSNNTSNNPAAYPNTNQNINKPAATAPSAMPSAPTNTLSPTSPNPLNSQATPKR